uniref:DNA-directed RNA polymerase n=1 Tax=Parastrongyloides trichosuri TaxID=131310 RepID=A0A0N5A5V1_PARTI
MDEEENKTDTKNILKELSGFTKAVENAISSVFSVPPTFGSLKKFPVNRIGGLQYPDSIDLSTEDYYCESVDSSTHKDLDKDFVKLALTAYCHVTGLVPLDAKFASLCIVKAFELNPCRESKDSLFNVMRSGQKSLESTFHFTKEGYRLSNYSERQELLLYSYLETHEVRSFNEFLKLLEDELKMNNQSKVAEGLKDKFFSRTKDASSIDSSDKAFQNILVWKKGKRLDVVLMDFVKVLLRLATKPEDHVIRELTTRKPSFPYTFQDNLSLGILKQLREEMIYVAPTVGWLLIALDYGIRHPGSNVINDKCKVIYNRDILLRMGYVGLKLIQQAINISKIPMYCYQLQQFI